MSKQSINWGQELPLARGKMGLTVQQLAKQVGVHSSQLGAIERFQLLPSEELESRLMSALRSVVSSSAE